MKRTPMTTQFTFVRHGETDWNRVKRFRGRAEIPLNENGIDQATRTAARLGAEKIDIAFASPLGRAMRTAEIILEPHRLRSEPEPALMDIDYGSWQGWTLEEAASRDPEIYQLWLNSPERVRFPGGESLTDVRERVSQLVEEWAAKYDGQTVLFVTH